MRAPVGKRLLWALPLGGALAFVVALGARQGGAGGASGAAQGAASAVPASPGAAPAPPSAGEPAASGRGRSARERPGRDRPRTPQPEALPNHDAGIRAYAEAKKAGDKNPGEKAFRAEARAFFDHNAAFAADMAQKKGITPGELAELTYLGLLGMSLRRWPLIEEIAGRPLSPEDRGRADDLILWASDTLKATLDEQVAKGSTEEARWQLIREHEARFIEQYCAITGLSPEAFDRLLAKGFDGQGASAPP